MKGVKVFSISQGILKGAKCRLPPLPEQTAIAEFLDRETGKIDGLVAEQRRLMELLKEKRQAVISHAVTKGLNPHAPMKPSGIEWLGDVPEGWEVKRLKHLGESIIGLTYSPAAGLAAFGAEHARTDVRQPDLDSSILDLEVDRLHPPGVIEAKQTGVMR